MVCRKLYSYCSYRLVTKGVHLKVSWGCTPSCPPALTAQHKHTSFDVMLTRDMFNQRGGGGKGNRKCAFHTAGKSFGEFVMGHCPHFTLGGREEWCSYSGTNNALLPSSLTCLLVLSAKTNSREGDVIFGSSYSRCMHISLQNTT